MFDFKALIQRFSKDKVYLLREVGSYDYENGGEYVRKQITEEQIEGAVVPLSMQDLKVAENGRYKKEDRKLYCYRTLNIGEKIRHKERIYIVNQMKDYGDFDDELHIYYIVRGER